MKLSQNFYLSEFLFSETAVRYEIDMTPSHEVIENLTKLCNEVLQPVRDALGPVNITSGYRPLKLNTLIRGSETSQHMNGEASDFNVSRLSPLIVCQWIDENLIYDQLIHEFGSWVHVSFSGKKRNQLLTAFKKNRKTVYKQGL